MKNISVASFVLSSVLFLGCGGESELSASDVEGTWTLSGFECDGSTVSFSGFSGQLELSDGNGILTSSSAECTATTNYVYVISSDGVVFSPQNTTCSPDNCTQHITLNGIDEVQTCPDDFGGSSSRPFKINGKTATITDNYNGVICIETYIKA